MGNNFNQSSNFLSVPRPGHYRYRSIKNVPPVGYYDDVDLELIKQRYPSWDLQPHITSPRSPVFIIIK